MKPSTLALKRIVESLDRMIWDYEQLENEFGGYKDQDELLTQINKGKEEAITSRNYFYSEYQKKLLT